MKVRYRKYYRFFSPFYNIEVNVDGHWLSVCSTMDLNITLVKRLKKTIEKMIEDGEDVIKN